MTEQQVADAIKVSRRTIINWEHDVCGPGVAVVGDLCDALGVPRAARYAFVFGREKRRPA